MPEPQVFISYCHKDRTWKDRLLTHLRPLEKKGLLSIWHDEQLSAGSRWLRDIETALFAAKVAILLVSADFLGSDFILQKEVPEILERRKSDRNFHVVPVIVKSCCWAEIEWLASMQVRPLYGKPLADHRGNQRDTQLAAIAVEVMGYISPAKLTYKTEETSTQESPRTLQAKPAHPHIAPLEQNVDILLDGKQTITTLEGFVLNSGRFLERYLELARQKGPHMGVARFIVPSTSAIRSAYRSKPKSQEQYLSETVRHIRSAWKNLEKQGVVGRVEFRRIDCVPRNLCVIKNRDLVLTGLYDPDQNHPLGLTCHRSWLHGDSRHSDEVCCSYIEWFGALWEESSPMP